MRNDHTELAEDGETSVLVVLSDISRRWPVVLGGVLIAGAASYGGALLVTPVFTARTVILPPQQQNSLPNALGSLGALAGIAGGIAGVKSPAEQYIALLSSVTVSDRIIDQYQLTDVYAETYRSDVRKQLLKNVTFAAGKKDSLITIDVDDIDPVRAAKMANSYVEQLKLISNTLALTEAQQRRQFFQDKLEAAQAGLTKAQIGLQGSGFNPGALKAEPKAAAEAYSRLRAEAVAAETRLQALRVTFADQSPEVRSQMTILASVRSELARIETPQPPLEDVDYISRYREYKYQETLFELFSRQYELARVDEGREGGLIQVIDPAQVPDKPAKPKKLVVAIFGALLGLLVSSIFILRQRQRRQQY